MRQTPILAVLAVAVLTGLGGAWGWSQHRADVPPETLRDAALTPAAEILNAEAAIRTYEARLRKDPADVRARVALAQAFLQQAKATADEATYVPKAEAALNEALRRDPDNVHALLLQASLLNTLHRFEDGEAAARRLLAAYPENAYARGVLVDALVELGRYDEAVAACDRLLALRPDAGSYARASYLRELHGQTAQAIDAMRLAADAGVAGREDRAWALHHLAGLYLGQGDTAKARVLYEGLLDERPTFVRARVGLGHLRLLAGRPQEAIAHLLRAAEEAPLEETYALLEEAYALAGDDARAHEASEQARAALQAAERMGERVDMETADFLADRGENLPEALRRAEREVRRRPGHLHANETYAWVLHKTGRSAEAVPYIERAMRLGTGDAMVHFRAGEIFRAAGRPAEAAAQYRAALDGHVHIESVRTAAAARAALGALTTAGARPAPAPLATGRPS